MQHSAAVYNPANTRPPQPPIPDPFVSSSSNDNQNRRHLSEVPNTLLNRINQLPSSSGPPRRLFDPDPQVAGIHDPFTTSTQAQATTYRPSAFINQLSMWSPPSHPRPQLIEIQHSISTLPSPNSCRLPSHHHHNNRLYISIHSTCYYTTRTSRSPTEPDSTINPAPSTARQTGTPSLHLRLCPRTLRLRSIKLPDHAARRAHSPTRELDLRAVGERRVSGAVCGCRECVEARCLRCIILKDAKRGTKSGRDIILRQRDMVYTVTFCILQRV